MFDLGLYLALYEGGGRLVVDAGQGGDVADELVQQGRLQQVRFLSWNIKMFIEL